MMRRVTEYRAAISLAAGVVDGMLKLRIDLVPAHQAVLALVHVCAPRCTRVRVPRFGGHMDHLDIEAVTVRAAQACHWRR